MSVLCYLKLINTMSNIKVNHVILSIFAEFFFHNVNMYISICMVSNPELLIVCSLPSTADELKHDQGTLC